MSNKIKLKIPVIVEGKYDKAHLSSIIDTVIIPTDGFGVFKNDEKRALIRTLGQGGLILLCDSDGGGQIIRSHLRGMLGGIALYDLYIPQISGKERRKQTPSAEGFLGVEGIPKDILREVFEKFALSHPELTDSVGESEHAKKTPVTRSQMFALGLTGGTDSSARRDALCEYLALPHGMSANALFSALNLISSAEELEKYAQIGNIKQ